jgi:hypothetical protein
MGRERDRDREQVTIGKRERELTLMRITERVWFSYWSLAAT